jgi:hypothetical protein
VPDETVRRSLAKMSPRARELLRRYLIADQPDRDALAHRLLAERTEGSIALADLVDTLTMYPDQRRRVVRLLGEMEGE